MKNILVVIEDDMPSVTLGVKQPLEYFKSRGMLSYSIVTYRHIFDILNDQIRNPRKKLIEQQKILERYDVLLLLRAFSEKPLTNLVYPFKSTPGKKVIYMLDDDFASLERHWSKQFFPEKFIPLYFEHADVSIVYSLGLLNKYSSISKNIQLLQGPSNVEIMDSYRKILRKNPRKLQSKRLVIGYAATIHHEKTFDICREAVRYILSKYRHAFFETFLDPKITNSRVHALSYVKDINKYYHTILQRNWTIGLAPLPNTEFHQSKSNNKYREYAGLGIPAIYSNVLPYTSSVISEKTGILVENTTDAWVGAIEQLILSAAQRESIKTHAMNEARTKYSMQTYLENYKKALGGILF